MLEVHQIAGDASEALQEGIFEGEFDLRRGFRDSDRGSPQPCKAQFDACQCHKPELAWGGL
jgi:hypothetical protein